MKSIAVSEFKAKCIGILKEVQRKRDPVLLTLRGKPVAIVHPVPEQRSGKRLGGLKGSMTIRQDLVRVDSSTDWEMLR